MKIYESAEDYLEKILMLTERNGEVRSIDIATEMGVTKPSVSIAMKNLRQAGYISMDGAGYITLEPPGLEIEFSMRGAAKAPTAAMYAGTENSPPDLGPPQKADPLFCCTGCGPYRCFPRCLQDRA